MQIFDDFNESYRQGLKPKSPLIIAELGTAHNGDIAKAKELIDAAHFSGAGCIKVQMVYADEILHPKTGEVPLPGGRIRLYDQFKSLEKPVEFYIEVKEYAESKKILFLCTPFGLKSASILREMKPKLVKIASPELNFAGLLEEVASWKVPVLLSSGVSTLGDIERAVGILKGTEDWGLGTGGRLLPENISCCSHAQITNNNPRFLVPSPQSPILLHCVTSYPAPETDYNLRVLPNLSAIFGIPVGVSDHSCNPELVPALSVAMGAVVVEKHFCLSRRDKGLDDPIALEPDDFSKMVKAIRRAAECDPKETIARYSRERGEALVEEILGSGIKKLAPSEKANYRLTNRSIHALRDIQKGEVLKRHDYAILRTEKVLRPGLEPNWEKAIEGRIAKEFIPAGEGIRFEDLG